MSLLHVMWLSLMEGEVVADPSFSVRPGSFGLAGPRSFGPLLLNIWRVPRGLPANWCRETPRIITPTMYYMGLFARRIRENLPGSDNDPRRPIRVGSS